jgi:DNA-binding PadR family transcriptional regulator
VTPGSTRTGVGLSSNEGVVLGMLARGSSTRAGLVRRIGRTVGYFWTPARSHVYGLLPRLVALGYVDAHRVEGEDGLERQVYGATAAGRSAVADWLRARDLADGPPRNPFLLKLFFGGLLERDEMVEHVRAQRDAVAAELAELEEIEASWSSDGDPYGWLALRYGLERDRATLRWAEEALAQLEAPEA